MGYKLVLAAGEMQKIRQRFMPDTAKLDSIYEKMKSQVDDRFRTDGASGGLPWRNKLIGDQHKLLEATNGTIQESIEGVVTRSTAQLSTQHIAAFYAQEGTTKYGGKLPNIMERRRKRNGQMGMFIPLTDAARRTRPVTPMGFRNKRLYDATLKRGRMDKYGRITPPDADFIYLPRVGIPTREFWPTSTTEQTAQDDHAVKVIKDGPQP
jgi:hypothetical protein